MSRFLSARHATLKPYVPGEQPKESNILKLNTNESPFPPSPEVIKAISGKELEDLRLYSDPAATALIKAIADYYDVDKNMVIAGNGSDEILAFCFMAFCDDKKGIIFPDITYGFYKVYGEFFNINYVEIPLLPDFSVNEKDYLNSKNNIIIANPNAVTSRKLEVYQIENIVKQNLDNIVIIDEAYIDFGNESCISLTKKYNNLVVVQTLSKSRNLAGARIGMAIAHADLIEDLNKMKFSFNPYNLNRLSILAGTKAVNDKKYFQKCMDEIVKTRSFTVKELENIGFKVVPPSANFILAKPPQIKAKVYFAKLRERNILVRYFEDEKVKDYVRITIGSIDQMKELINATKEILQCK